MILDQLKIIEPPDQEWLTRLKRGHFVWIVKESIFGAIDFAWAAPTPGAWTRQTGRIGIKKCWRNNNDWGFCQIESWFVQSNGTGFDGKPLLFPVEGKCPKEEPELSPIWVTNIEKQLALLTNKINRLERGASKDYWRI